jgi:hypothetical protein
MTTLVKESFRIHVLKRFLERYGSRLNFTEYGMLCKFATERKKETYFYIRSLKNNSTECFVNLYSTWFPIVFDEENKIVLTVLPRESVFSYLGRLSCHQEKLLKNKINIQVMEKPPSIYNNNIRFKRKPAFLVNYGSKK